MDELNVLDDERSEIKLRIKQGCNPQDRLRHFVVDTVIQLILLGLFFQHVVDGIDPDYVRENNLVWIFLIATNFIYYFFCERIFGATPGYFLNKTRVITINEERPTLKATFIRCMARFIPLGYLSVFYPPFRPLHDILSKTRMVRIK